MGDEKKSLGYPIRPDGEEEYFTEGRQKNMKPLYFIAKTPIGKLAISDHCKHAKDEMMALEQVFKEMQKETKITMPVWERLKKLAKL